MIAGCKSLNMIILGLKSKVLLESYIEQLSTCNLLDNTDRGWCKNV